VPERDDADGTASLDVGARRRLSGGEVVGQENDAPLFSDRNRRAFSGIQFFSFDSALIGFEGFLREVDKPVRSTTGLDFLISRLWYEQRVKRREQFERTDLGEMNERSPSETAASVTRSGPGRHLPRRPRALAPPVRSSFDDALDGFLAVEVVVEVLCEHEALPQAFETAFQRPFEHLGLWQAASLRDFSNSVGHFGGHTAWWPGNLDESVSLPSDENPTGAYVYRGHDWILLQTPSTVENGGLGTHDSQFSPQFRLHLLVLAAPGTLAPDGTVVITHPCSIADSATSPRSSVSVCSNCLVRSEAPPLFG